MNHHDTREQIADSQFDPEPQWRSDKPPNETWVQVMDGENIVEAMAFFGRDGYRPHWRLRNESFCHPSRFTRWREIPLSPAEMEQQWREEFEAFASGEPFVRSVKRLAEQSAWPGQYYHTDVQFAWQAFLKAKRG